MPTLETRRLILRPLDPDDAPALAALFAGDLEAVEQTGRMPWPPTETALREWIGLHLTAGSFGFAMTRRGDGKLLGTAGFGGDEASTELGYALGRAHWRQGYATEAVGALVGFARDLGLQALDGYSFLDNPASARVLEKAGFVEQGVVARDYPRRGGLREVRHFRRTLEGRD